MFVEGKKKSNKVITVNNPKKLPFESGTLIFLQTLFFFAILIPNLKFIIKLLLPIEIGMYFERLVKSAYKSPLVELNQR